MTKPHVFLTLSWLVFAAATVVKVIIGTGYRSTDFEVHRNWLAITHSLPMSQWYFESTSVWTLDYPPYFAYFEWLLSQFAPIFDSDMLKVSNLGYDSTATVFFQRASVILADIVLLFGSYRFVAAMWHDSYRPITPDDNGKQKLHNDLLEIKAVRIIIITLLNAGLFMLDHIHFQYNGMLLGLLLLSLAAIKGDRPLEGAFWFAVLLQFKHIFLYIAPIYGVYLLRSYCLGKTQWWNPRQLQVKHILSLAAVLALVFVTSLGPFVALGQVDQLVSRLFPFKRGLVHAYWAPNVWAIYMFIDLLLARVFGVRSAIPTATSGLVGSTSTLVLPDVPPLITLILTIATMLPLLEKVWKKPTKETFLFALVPVSLCSFLFGWHVHEKAILITIIPFGLIAFEKVEWSSSFETLCLAGHFSLLPLFVNQGVDLTIVFLLLAHVFLVYKFVSRFFDREKETEEVITEWEHEHPEGSKASPSERRRHSNQDVPEAKRKKSVSSAQSSLFGPTLLGVLLLLAVNYLILPTLMPSFEFLPLMLTSVFCATVITAEFFRLASLTIRL